MLKVRKKSLEPFRIYQLTSTVNPAQFDKLLMAGVAVPKPKAIIAVIPKVYAVIASPFSELVDPKWLPELFSYFQHGFVS